MAANVAVAEDLAGNLEAAKDKSTERIDGIVTAIVATGRAMVAQEEPQLLCLTRWMAANVAVRRVISVATTCCRTELAGSRETAFVVPGDHGLRGVARQAMQPSTPVCFGRFATGQVKYETNAADILTKSKTKSLADRIFLADHRKLKSVDQFDHRTMVADGSAQELGVSGF